MGELDEPIPAGGGRAGRAHSCPAGAKGGELDEPIPAGGGASWTDPFLPPRGGGVALLGANPSLRWDSEPPPSPDPVVLPPSPPAGQVVAPPEGRSVPPALWPEPLSRDKPDPRQVGAGPERWGRGGGTRREWGGEWDQEATWIWGHTDSGGWDLVWGALPPLPVSPRPLTRLCFPLQELGYIMRLNEGPTRSFQAPVTVRNYPSSHVYVFPDGRWDSDESSEEEFDVVELRPRGKEQQRRAASREKVGDVVLLEREITAGDSLNKLALQYGCKVRAGLPRRMQLL